MGQLATVIATEDSEFRTAVTQLVRSSGVPVSIVVERASENGGGAPAIALVDVRSDGAALTDVERLRARWPGLAIMAVAGASEPDLILQAMRAGANEFFAWPRGNGGPPAAMQEGISAAVRRAAERLQAASPGTGDQRRTDATRSCLRKRFPNTSRVPRSSSLKPRLSQIRPLSLE